MQGPPKPEPKPKDCTCSFPKGIARNPTGHAQTCAVYKRIMAEVLKDAGEYIAPHNIIASPLPQGTDEAQPDQFGPLELGTEGAPFIYPEELGMPGQAGRK